MSMYLHPTIVVATVASFQPSRITHSGIGIAPYWRLFPQLRLTSPHLIPPPRPSLENGSLPSAVALVLLRRKRERRRHNSKLPCRGRGQTRRRAATADGSGRGASLGLWTSITGNHTRLVQFHDIRLFPPPPLSRSPLVQSVRCSSGRVQGCAMETAISFEHSHDAVVLVDRLAPPEFCARGAEDPHSVLPAHRYRAPHNEMRRVFCPLPIWLMVNKCEASFFSFAMADLMLFFLGLAAHLSRRRGDIAPVAGAFARKTQPTPPAAFSTDSRIFHASLPFSLYLLCSLESESPTEYTTSTIRMHLTHLTRPASLAASIPTLPLLLSSRWSVIMHSLHATNDQYDYLLNGAY
ncbi:hypothetical protein DFH09DRAFT_1086931 [Mycena vulgaris]|nr:hypothetical protein DFH09DRAFT_1086931 [Mycena vulgaris]